MDGSCVKDACPLEQAQNYASITALVARNDLLRSNFSSSVPWVVGQNIPSGNFMLPTIAMNADELPIMGLP